MATAIEYIYDNAERLGVDKTKVAVQGQSGGGWICIGSLLWLSK